MAGSPNASQSQGYATVVGFGASRGDLSVPTAAAATLDPPPEPVWLQEEMKRMEAYTFAQMAKLEEQRKALLHHQMEVEKDLVLKKQQLNQQVCLINSRAAALQKREHAVAEREAALTAESERLRKSQQDLLAMFQSRTPTPAEAPPCPPAEPAPAVRQESALPAESAGGVSPPPAIPVDATPPVRPTPAPTRRPDPIAPTKVSPGHQAAKAAAHKEEAPPKPASGLRSGNPVSVTVLRAGEDAEPAPGWVIARSATELHLLADEAIEVGSLLTVRPTKAPAPFPGVPVKVTDCRSERNQWMLHCQMLQRLSGAFRQLFG